MELRHWIGFAFLIAGISLQPIGWMFFTWVHIVSFVLILVGVALVITDRYIEYSDGGKFWGYGSTALPGDIHGYSGWDKGGRTEAWSTSQDGCGDGAGVGE